MGRKGWEQPNARLFSKIQTIADNQPYDKTTFVYK